MSSMTREVFTFMRPNWISCRLVEGLSTVCHLEGRGGGGGVIKNGILRPSFLLFESTFWNLFVALSSPSRKNFVYVVYSQEFILH